MRRYALKRDQSEAAIVEALLAAGCGVIRGNDVDLYVRLPSRSYSSPIEAVERSRIVLMECKTKGPNQKRRQPIQLDLAALCGSQYMIVYCVEDALRAVGVL